MSTSEIFDRLPPYDLEAERQVLGCILIDPKCVDGVAGMLKPDDFYAASNRVIYGHLLRMAQQSRDIDATLLIDRLRTEGDLEAVGGTAYLAEVIQSVAVTAHWRHYAGIVLRHSQKRSLIQAATAALREAYDPSEKAEDVLNRLEAVLSGITTGNQEAEPCTMQAALVEAIGMVDVINRKKRPPGIHTGLWEFDARIGGFFPGELSIIAARPGQGKTSLSLQVADRCSRAGLRTYFATLEMGRVELALKRMCSEANVSLHAVRTGRLDREDKAALTEAAGRVASNHWFLHDWSEIRVWDVERAARRLKAEIVFVDYLQIVTPRDVRKKRYEQVGDLCKDLKAMARRLHVPVVVCCQLNRSADEKAPEVKDLRESGDIEACADMIILLHRPPSGLSDEAKTDHWSANLMLKKNRLGPPGAFKLDWTGRTTTFRCHEEEPGPSDQQEEMF